MKVLNTMHCVRIVAASVLLLLLTVDASGSERASFFAPKAQIHRRSLSIHMQKQISKKEWNKKTPREQSAILMMDLANAKNKREQQRLVAEAARKKRERELNEKGVCVNELVEHYKPKSTFELVKEIIQKVNAVKGNLETLQLVFKNIVIENATEQTTKFTAAQLRQLKDVQPQVVSAGINDVVTISVGSVKCIFGMLSQQSFSLDNNLEIAVKLCKCIPRMFSFCSRVETHLETIMQDIVDKADYVTDPLETIAFESGEGFLKLCKSLWDKFTKKTEAGLMNGLLNVIKPGVDVVAETIEKIANHEKFAIYKGSVGASAIKGALKGLGMNQEAANKIGLAVDSVGKVRKFARDCKDFFTNWGKKIIQWIKDRKTKKAGDDRGDYASVAQS